LLEGGSGLDDFDATGPMSETTTDDPRTSGPATAPAWRRLAIALDATILVASSVGLSAVATVERGGWVALPAAIALAVAGATLLMLLTRTWGAFFLASAPIAILAPAFAWYFLAFREYPDDNAAIVALTSTFSEATGWLDVLGLWPGITAWAAASALYLAVATLLWRSPMPRALRRAQAIALVPALALAVALPVRGADGRNEIAPSDALFVHLTSSYPIGAWLWTVASWNEAFRTLGASVDKRPYGATYADRDGVAETHVVVIGESARYDAFGMHGYARDTSPALPSIPGLVSYSRAYSPANITYLSVPMMLAGDSPAEHRVGDVRGTIVDAMREAGYRTAWLSNQEAYVARMLSPPADRWCMPADLARSGWERTQPDGVLLSCLDRELAERAQRRFIVLHTYGSHWDYAQRLPDGAFRWSGLTRASAARAVASAPDPDRLRRDLYDDTILYSTGFLADVIARLRALPGRVSFTYLSDHGESFLATDGVRGHGTTRFSTAEMHVPWLFWANDRLKADRADAWRNVVAHRDDVVRGDSLFATAAALGGVTIPGVDARKDLASRAFVPLDDRGAVEVLAGGRLARLDDAVDGAAYARGDATRLSARAR